jgi:hypothetical protein
MAELVHVTLDLTDTEAVALATVIRGLRPPDDFAAAWFRALDQLSPQLPTPTRDAVFEQLKADVLEALAEADRGEGVSEEEMRAMFGLDKPPMPESPHRKSPQNKPKTGISMVSWCCSVMGS